MLVFLPGGFYFFSKSRVKTLSIIAKSMLLA